MSSKRQERETSAIRHSLTKTRDISEAPGFKVSASFEQTKMSEIENGLHLREKSTDGSRDEDKWKGRGGVEDVCVDGG